MKVERKSDHPVGDAACKASTGRTLAEWFKLLDQRGGIEAGRRELGSWLVNDRKIDPWWSATLVNEFEIARGALAKDGKPRGYTICATKSIKADAARCYAAFATAKALDAWYGEANELRLVEGGSWRNADGNRATIRKVNANKNIRLIAEDAGLTMPAPMEIKFAASGAKCSVMVTIDRLQTRAEADGLRRAWGEALERLKSTLEG
jgi:uncharacterized protein YndB with AHSA1/START domain